MESEPKQEGVKPAEVQNESNEMVVEDDTSANKRTSPRKKATPKQPTPKKATEKKTTPKKVTPKKATPPKPSNKPAQTPEKEIDPNKRTRSKSQTNWSDLLYGSGEKYIEGDTLAVRAPGESGELFWLCILDGVGTEENPDDLEITWFESKGNGVYAEGEEDDISADTVICKTRLNAGPNDTWVLPQVELKTIKDNLKLEKEESSEVDEKEGFSGDEESEKSLKEGEENEAIKSFKEAKRESKSGEKRKSSNNNLDANGEPKPKRQYKKREKKITTDTTVPENSNITALTTENQNTMITTTDVAITNGQNITTMNT